MQAHYVVEAHDGYWTVSLNGSAHGPYSSQEAAVRAATNAAREAEAMGHDAHVEVREPPTAAPEAEAA